MVYKYRLKMTHRIICARQTKQGDGPAEETMQSAGYQQTACAAVQPGLDLR